MPLIEGMVDLGENLVNPRELEIEPCQMLPEAFASGMFLFRIFIAAYPRLKG
jgi:hypothetical protein